MRKIEISRADLRVDAQPGAAPILQWIEIEQLVVDDSYQRELRRANWTAIRKIAATFRWSMFSPVFVAPVEGGGYAIIDGQHRTHAAAMCGFKQVPCQIVLMTREEQAASFAAVNGVVTQVTPFQLLKAGIAAGEEWAVTADEIAKEGGCQLMTSNGSRDSKRPGRIYGVKSFLAFVERRPRAAIVAALRHLMSTEGYNDNVDVWDMSRLLPLLMALSERSPALAHPGFSEALAMFDFWGMIDRDGYNRDAARRRGTPYPPKSETLRTGVLEWLDMTFPARMSLPKPGVAA